MRSFIVILAVFVFGAATASAWRLDAVGARWDPGEMMAAYAEFNVTDVSHLDQFTIGDAGFPECTTTLRPHGLVYESDEFMDCQFGKIIDFWFTFNRTAFDDRFPGFIDIDNIQVLNLVIGDRWLTVMIDNESVWVDDIQFPAALRVNHLVIDLVDKRVLLNGNEADLSGRIPVIPSDIREYSNIQCQIAGKPGTVALFGLDSMYTHAAWSGLVDVQLREIPQLFRSDDGFDHRYDLETKIYTLHVTLLKILECIVKPHGVLDISRFTFSVGQNSKPILLEWKENNELRVVVSVGDHRR